MFKPIICLDFDGVLHSYVSGWKGARRIPDPPVPGAIEWLFHLVNDQRVEVCILSSRSHQWGGRRAMKNWLREHLVEFFWKKYGTGRLQDIGKQAPLSEFFGDIDDDFTGWANLILKDVGFPTHKPPAHITIDDRALGFGGVFPTIDQLLAFRPWRVSVDDLDAAESSAQAT